MEAFQFMNFGGAAKTMSLNPSCPTQNHAHRQLSEDYAPSIKLSSLSKSILTRRSWMEWLGFELYACFYALQTPLSELPTPVFSSSGRVNPSLPDSDSKSPHVGLPDTGLGPRFLPAPPPWSNSSAHKTPTQTRTALPTGVTLVPQIVPATNSPSAASQRLHNGGPNSNATLFAKPIGTNFIFAARVLIHPVDAVLVAPSTFTTSTRNIGGEVWTGQGVPASTQATQDASVDPNTGLKGPASPSTDEFGPSITTPPMNGGTMENVQDSAISQYISAGSSLSLQATQTSNNELPGHTIAGENQVPNDNQQQNGNGVTSQDTSSQGLQITPIHADGASGAPPDGLLSPSLAASSTSRSPSSFSFGSNPGQVDPNNLSTDQLSELHQVLSPTPSAWTGTAPSISNANPDSVSPPASRKVANASPNLAPADIGLGPGQSPGSLSSSPGSGIVGSNPNGDARSKPGGPSSNTDPHSNAGSWSKDLGMASEGSGPGPDNIRGASNGGLIFGSSTLQPGAQVTDAGHVISVGSAVAFADGTTYTFGAIHRPQPAGGSVSALQGADNLVLQAASQGGGQTPIPPGTKVAMFDSIVSATGSADAYIDASPVASTTAESAPPMQTSKPVLYEAADGGLVLGSVTLPPGVQTTRSGHTLSIGTGVVAVDGDIYTWSAGASLQQVRPSSIDSKASGRLAPFGRSDLFASGQAATSRRNFVDQAGSTEVSLEVSSATPAPSNDDIQGLITSEFGDGVAATATGGGIVMQPGSAPTSGSVLRASHAAKSNRGAYKAQILSWHKVLLVAISVSIRYVS
ncbi:hypothetical protein N7G274_010172 [Stereocaulon virgatum]|uniref:Uncharacterized protein n=1 Tax=Stereocaulon virgatum TaxID=373712 RepID=A0ABR3ZV78_9LECA